MKGLAYDPTASEGMGAVVRMAVAAVTAALFLGSTFNGLLGHRELAVLFALATPLGICAWAFARAGHNEAAMVMLCTVLIAVVTLVLVLNPLGAHGVALSGYGGVVLAGAALLARRAFLAVVALTLAAGAAAFALDATGLSHSVIAGRSGWPQFVEFLAIVSIFAIVGRVAVERVFRSLARAHGAAARDPVTGLLNRTGFRRSVDARLRDAGQGAVMVLADLDGFRRLNVVIGHEAADHVLKEAARRFEAAAGGHACARVGDDELAAFATGVDEEAARALARSLHASLDFEFLGVEVRSAAGFARAASPQAKADALWNGAEAALAEAKARGHPRIAGHPGGI